MSMKKKQMCVDFNAYLSGVTHMRQELTVWQIKSHFSIVCIFYLFSLFIKKKRLLNNYYCLLYQCIIANKKFFFCRSNINYSRKSGPEQPRPSCIGITVPTWQPQIDYGCSIPTTIIAHTIFPFTPYSIAPQQ